MPPTSEWAWDACEEQSGATSLRTLLSPDLVCTALHPLLSFCSPAGMRSMTSMKKAKSECAGQGGGREAWGQTSCGERAPTCHGLT